MWHRKLFDFRNLSTIARATVFPFDQASSKRQFILIYFIRLSFLVGRRLWRDQCPRHAAALSFQTILSLVPLFAVALVVANALDLAGYQERMFQFLKSNLLPTAANDIGQQIADLVRAFKTKTLSIVSGTTLVIMSMTLLFTIEGTINTIFGTPVRRKFILRVVVATMIMLLAPVAFSLSLYFTGELLTLPGFTAAGLPLFFTVTALFFCYWLLPHTQINIRHALLSAAIAGILFELTKVGFAIYTRHLGETLSYLYGTFAILPLFMVWVYFAWLIFLFGAEFNAALHEVHYYDRFGNDSKTAKP